jgi:hypothetical protein
MARGTLIKLLIALILLIIGAMVAGAYFDFNPVIPIFVILGFGIYMVGRIGGPQLPEGAHVSFGDTYGVYLHREDFVPPDADLNWRKDKEAARASQGDTLRDGVDPADPKRRVNRPP